MEEVKEEIKLSKHVVGLANIKTLVFWGTENEKASLFSNDAYSYKLCVIVMLKMQFCVLLCSDWKQFGHGHGRDIP